MLSGPSELTFFDFFDDVSDHPRFDDKEVAELSLNLRFIWNEVDSVCKVSRKVCELFRQ